MARPGLAHRGAQQSREGSEGSEGRREAMAVRNTYKYQYKVGNKIKHGGITDNLNRRELEHQRRWPKGHILKIGQRTTEEGGRRWERSKGYA